MRLPKDQQQLVDMLWESELQEHPTWFRGEVFTIQEIRQELLRTEFSLARTDYAHYLSTLRGLIDPQYACQVLYGAAILRTQDHYLVLGEMGKHTTYPGRLQCVAGGISDVDIESGHVHLERGVLREITEETGIESANLVPRWLKMGGPYHFVVVLYEATVGMDLRTLESQYDHFVKRLESRGETPELSRLVSLKATANAVAAFVGDDPRPRVDYLDGFLERIVSNRHGA